MNKKIIALAVAAAISAPAFADTANVTVYGRAHLSLDSNSGNSGSSATGTKNGLNLASNASRLGFKGTEDLGSGLKAVYQFETEVSTQGSTGLFAAQRDTYVGVAGDYGTLIAGRLPLANQYVGDANFFGDRVGDAGNFTAGGFGGAGLLAVPSRINRAVAYASPAFGGVTLLAAFVPNTAQSISGTQNVAYKTSSYTLRGAYDSNGVFAAANYVNIGGITGTSSTAQDAKIKIVSLAGGYDFGIAKVRAQLVNSDANAQAQATGAKQTVYTVGGQFNLGENDIIKAQFAKAQQLKLGGASVAGSDAKLLAVGYDHNLSKRTTVYAAYAKVSNGTASQFSATNYAHGGVGTPGAGFSPSALSVGVIHNF